MGKKYIQGDIHEVIKTLERNSVDFIYTDPPFGITSAKWDNGLRWDELFKEMWRVLKPKGVICIYASMPFTYELVKHQKPKYNYTWIKNNSTGFFAAKYQPLRQTEEIFVYYKKAGGYNPQMCGDLTEFHPKRKVKYGGKNGYWGKEGINKKDEYDHSKEAGHYGRFPTNVIDFKVRKDKTGITRTDEHIDHFIKTYSKEGETVLDMTCHNHYVGDRCVALNRNYIGVDIDLSNVKKSE
jgi:site-specific DNA-methyltransferase (adenine-specific)